MKKLATLLLAAGMVVAASAPASAADIKVGGFHAFTFETGNTGFTGANDEEVLQRTRLNLTIAASENLKGFIEFQMGTDNWGDYGTGNKHGRYNVQTRQAYADWTIPATNVKVRMGRSCFGLPAEAFGRNSVMDAGWGGRDAIIVTAPVADWLNVTAFWNRAATDGTDVDSSNNADMFGLAAALKFNGFAVTPYVAYASIDDGAAAGVGVSQVKDGSFGMAETKKDDKPTGKYGVTSLSADSNAYWVGVTATLTAFDPFTLKLSAVYGCQEFEGDGVAAATTPNTLGEDRKGWNVQAKASYKLGFGTPVLGAWYGSGDDADEKFLRAGWMPSVNGRFLASSTFHDGAYGLGGNISTNNICGTWGVQAGIEGMSFINGLTHDVKVTYIQGTNNETMTAKAGFDLDAYNYMTTADSTVELFLGSTYQIYKNLAVNLELAYLINDFGAEVYKDADEDDWRAALTFNYKF